MKPALAFQIPLLAISGFGVFAGAQLSITHIQQGEICPLLGPIPACFVVFIGYSLMFIAAIKATSTFSGKLFYIGLTPIFLLAAFGVVMEIIQGSICPDGLLGIPQCVFSLIMALASLGLFFGLRRAVKNEV